MVDKRPETQDQRALSKLSEKNGVQISSIHAPFLLASRKVWGRPLEKIEKSIELAKKLHSRVVVVHLPYFWQVEYARWLYRNINSLNRGEDIEIAVENAILVKVWKRWNLSYFNNLNELSHFDRLVFDTSHFAISRTDIFSAWECLKEKVAHIHLSNNFLKGFDDHALPFNGRLPLGPFLKRVAADGYDGDIVLELSPNSLEAKWGRSTIIYNLQASLEFCRSHFQKSSPNAS